MLCLCVKGYCARSALMEAFSGVLIALFWPNWNSCSPCTASFFFCCILTKKKAKDRTSALQKKRKEECSNRLLHSCPHSCAAELLAFDPRAFSLLLTRELRKWFYARHRNFVGLTSFVFSVEFRFRVDADWSSCVRLPALWTHVHSFSACCLWWWCGCSLFGFAFAVFWVLLFSAACACTIGG